MCFTKMTFKNATVTILYGSETGNAQDLAERIWRESKWYHFTGIVRSMDDYDVPELVNENCVIFVCSTTGQGEEPDNMKTFWRFLLRKSLPGNSLKNLRYAVLGLGDSSYVKFNFVAKRLNKRLMQLGGQMLIPLGLGDDQHDLGYDAATDPWIESLWSNLLTIYPLPYGVWPLDKNQRIVPRWRVDTYLGSDNSHNEKSIYYSTRPSNVFSVTVKNNTRVTRPDHFQDVRLIKLKTKGEHYIPGDVVSLRPKNLIHQVDAFQRVLKENGIDISPRTTFNISETDGEIPVPPHLRFSVSFQQLCEEYFDLTSIPRRRVFEILAQMSDSELEKEKCVEFTTPEGQSDLYNYCNRPRRNIVEVLEDFPHATKNLTTDLLFELLQPIKPRDFSIASSYKFHGDEIHILVAVVQYKTKLIKERLGLCSNYLAGLKKNDEVSVWIKRGSFRFPENEIGPIIMVGPGTGVAPFWSYISERLKEGTASAKDLILFFGCRCKEKDYYCSAYEKLHEHGKLNLVTAFSREKDHKIYVQHKILERGDLVWEALSMNRAHIFVAGNSKNMPQEVRESFGRVCVSEGGMSPTEAEHFLHKMEKSGRYQTETWS